MTKKQVLIVLGIICFTSIAIGLLSLVTDDAGWLGIVAGFGVAYIAGGLVLLAGVVKIIHMLTSKKTPPEQKKWVQKRLLFIAVAAVAIFIISYFRTPH